MWLKHCINGEKDDIAITLILLSKPNLKFVFVNEKLGQVVGAQGISIFNPSMKLKKPYHNNSF